MDFTIAIGDGTFPGRLPLIPTRFQIGSAGAEALDRARAAKHARRAKAVDNALWEMSLIHSAALGACWAGEPLDCPSLRELGYSVPDYGEAVLDALLRRGMSVGDVTRAARATYERVLESVPTAAEVDEAAAPFGDPAERSTATT